MISMEEEEGNNNNKALVFKYICKLCKKRFPCGRSLGGHMRSHLSNNSSKSLSGSDNNEKRKKRKRSQRRRRIPSSCVDVSEEVVAMCLLMLSRDASTSQNKVKCLEEESNTMKRNRFECTSCNKTFHSYQALGGHRASHKKAKTDCINTTTHQAHRTEEEEEEAKIIPSTNNRSKGHECPICLKVFPSGQALGGHKRSHLTNNKGIDVIQNPVVPKIRDLLDLNLPAPTHNKQQEEDHDDDNNGHHFISNSPIPWWFQTTHKHNPLLALISN